jgi:hypothetical protein
MEDYGISDPTAGMGKFRIFLFDLQLKLLGFRLNFLACPFCGSWKRKTESSTERFDHSGEGGVLIKRFTVRCGHCNELLTESRDQRTYPATEVA